MPLPDDILAALDARLQQEREAQKAEREKEKQEQEKVRTQAQLQEYAETQAKDAGLDMTKDTDDYELFYGFAGRAPGETPDDQIKWAIERVQKFKTAAGATVLKAKDKAKQRQKETVVLERSGVQRVPGSRDDAPVQPMQISDVLVQTQKRI